MPAMPSRARATGLVCVALGGMLGCRSAPGKLAATDAGARNQGTGDAIASAGDGADAGVGAPDFSFPPISFGDEDGGAEAGVFNNPWCRSGEMIVCFGADPAPYEAYLFSRDGGPPVGQCPTIRDFYGSPVSEGCLWVGCGPGTPDAGAPPDADAGDAAAPCCFRVARACGV